MACIAGSAGAATITGWNTANVAVSTTTAGVAGESVIYNRAPGAAGATTSGKVIFDGDEADTAGLKVLTGKFTAGGQTTGGCIMANSAAVCDSPFQSGKRFKNVLTGFKPVDFTFDTDPNLETEDGAPYQVFHRLINQTGADIAGFTISLGTGVGDLFAPSTTGDALRFSASFGFGPSDAPATSQFPFGLFGNAAQNQNFDIDGFFAPERSGFDMAFGEDQIASAGIYGPYQSLFGPWLSLDEAPFGAFWDDDGNPDTDGVLIGWQREDGKWEQRRDVDANGDLFSLTTPVAFDTLAALDAAFAFTLFDDVIEDHANLNVNYAIDLTGYQGTSFTLRVQATPAPVPLPAAAPLLVAGLGGLALLGRRRKA